MTYLEFKERIKENIFTNLDVLKYFNEENQQNIKIQLSRFVKKGLLVNIKRGLYCYYPKALDELELAGRLYQPSYVSLETALNYYGIIPDIPQAVTSVTVTTTKKIETSLGNYYYTKIAKPLFFGYLKIKAENSSSYFNLAKKEKAILDYFYVRKIADLSDLRFDLKGIDRNLYKKYAKLFPSWLPEVKS